MKKYIITFGISLLIFILLNFNISYSISTRNYYPKNVRIHKANKTIYTEDWGLSWKKVDLQKNKYIKPKNMLLKKADDFLYRTSNQGLTWFRVDKNDNFCNSYLSVYPNPTLNKIKVEFYISKSEIVKFEIYNLLGIKLKTVESNDIKSGVNILETDVNELIPGKYFIRITGESINLTGKFTKLY